MQALSQLSYGPTMLEREFYACEEHSPRGCERFLRRHADKQKAPTGVGAFCFVTGVPTGIRTPVATVKG